MNRQSTEFDLDVMLERLQGGISRMMDGDSAVFRRLLSDRDDIALLGAYGRCAVGQRQVLDRFEQTATGYAGGGGQSTHELVCSWAGNNLACTVTVEHHATRLDATQDVVPFLYRATHLWRREKSDWKIVLRHADPLATFVGPQVAHAIAQGAVR